MAGSVFAISGLVLNAGSGKVKRYLRRHLRVSGERRGKRKPTQPYRRSR